MLLLRRREPERKQSQIKIRRRLIAKDITNVHAQVNLYLHLVPDLCTSKAYAISPGCFTCRLRRKKCDENRPACNACRGLHLKCEYKRPMWWSDNETKGRNKEEIKAIIRSTQLKRKSVSTPPSLCHSLATPEACSESKRQSRAPSVLTPYSAECAFARASPEDYFAIPPLDPSLAQYPMFSPYEVDIKTERQIFVNDVPTRSDSITSTFNTFEPPGISTGTPGYLPDSWVQQEYMDCNKNHLPRNQSTLTFSSSPMAI